MQMTERNCPNCHTPLEIVEGELSPAKQEGGNIVDAEWGEWLECPTCGHQESISVPDDDDYNPE